MIPVFGIAANCPNLISPAGYSAGERVEIYRGRTSPLHDLPDLVRLPFAHHELQRIAERQAPSRALQSQINPHFLFNAINTLYGTIPREAGGARRMVLNLSEIFRYFPQSDRTFVPLAQELQIVRAYLEIEQLRIGDRLRVEFNVDEAALHVPVPVLSVQPLVENTVKHGVASSAEPGYVHVRIQLHGGELRVSVENSNGHATADVTSTGMGLQNVRRRLEICYGPGATLRLVPDPQKTTAEICIPLAEG